MGLKDELRRIGHMSFYEYWNSEYAGKVGAFLLRFIAKLYVRWSE